MLNCQVLIEKLPRINQNTCLLKMNWKKLKTFDSFWSHLEESHFEEDDTQNYLVFRPIYRYFKMIAGVDNDSYIY